jgi:hypothetical protein
MRRTSGILAVVSLLVAAVCLGLLSWVLIEPSRWLPDKDSGREVAALQRQVDDLEEKNRQLTASVEQQRRYAVAVEGLCLGFRSIRGLNVQSEEYALVVARALVKGIVDSCTYGEVPSEAVLKP